MWAEVLGLIGLGLASALIPLINIEAIVAVAATQDRVPGWLLVAAATVGQMAGKIVWFYGGREIDRFSFIAKRMRRPRSAAALEKWRSRTQGRPWFTAGLLLVSATAGLPPYAVISVLAGALRVRLWVFLVTGLVGRALRFWGVVGGTTALSRGGEAPRLARLTHLRRPAPREMTSN